MKHIDLEKFANGEPRFKLGEAEGGLWKNKAMENIKKYLGDWLDAFIGNSRITIIS